MKALKPFGVLFAVAITSCYFFPFILASLPLANSKMILAVIGLVLLGISLTKSGNGIFDRDFLDVSLWAFAVSFIAFISITINHTPDNTFTTYFMSMWVWLGGSYAVIRLIKAIHGGISVQLVVSYLLAVCVLQCILALVFDNFPAASQWHKSTFSGEGYMGNTDEDRLHGIGCSLDVAGFRFASVIVMASYITYLSFRKNKYFPVVIYLCAIFFITIVGDMISRSTIVGIGVALSFLIIISIFQRGNSRLFMIIASVIAITVVISTYLYNTNEVFKDNLRFGFEGFFSLFEKGEWQTNSNDILKNMVVWPNNAKTWLIGDGYINNPIDNSLETFDPYYVGEIYGGYYKGTDIGYLRYIFYFGLVGLVAFSLFFIQVCAICIRRFEIFKWMFIMMLAINFIQWFKVSTDLFVVFAPFLCISAKENDDYLKISSENLEKK